MDVVETTSRNGNAHLHCTLTSGDIMNGLTEREVQLARIALQACLGSDPMREFLSVKRVSRNHDTPTVLFELPDAARVPVQVPAPRRRAIATKDEAVAC